jgi:hypothetical protein
MKPPAKDNALNFVGPIMTAYKAIMKAEGSALERAIECGKYLALAKENVEATNRKWLPWLKEHCPEIHRNTAALYMRLADPEKADAIAECKSIREADVKLRRPPDDDGESEDDSDEADDGADDDAQRVVQTHASPDLKELLENCAVDEIGIALRDADKLDEFTTAAIAKMSPDKVCEVLIEAWDVKPLRDLAQRIIAHLNTLSPSTSRDLGVRPIPLAQPSPTN